MGCCDAPGLMPIEEAMDKMLSPIKPIQTTLQLPLAEAIGFVLAEDILSPIFVPPFDNSAMDGYAIRTSELSTVQTLPVSGQSFAGVPFNGTLSEKSCIRIMTGAEIPFDYDAVIMQEDVEVSDKGITFDIERVSKYQNIRFKGNDIQKNDVALESGTRLTARDIALLATLGIDEVKVVRKPRVAFFSTGDELRPVGEKLNSGQIYDSNRYAVRAMLEKLGCEAIDLGIVPDSPERLTETFKHAQSISDLIISTGGVSVGEADYTKDVLAALGEINFWKLAIKPGKPFAFGKIENTLFCGLPGNPVSAMVTMYVLVQPLIAKLAAHSKWQKPTTLLATTRSDFKKSPGRTDYQRGIYTVEDGKIFVETTGNQSSGAFRSMSLANCFIVLERERSSVEKGETVTIELFNSTFY